MKLIIFIIFLLIPNLVYAGCEDSPTSEVDWTNCNLPDELDLSGQSLPNAKMTRH